MAEITATMVKDLREKTGAGMMDCKKALGEVNGDFEQAVDWLRTKGLAAAAKKASRVAAEGLIGVASNATSAAIVEVNSETDFVARNEQFQVLVRDIAQAAVSVKGDVESLKNAKVEDSTVADALTNLVAVIGENMTIRRSDCLSVSKGVVATYIHNASAPQLGRIGVLVALESEANPDELLALGKKLAMHVAASSPVALKVSDVSADALEREKNILIEQAKSTGRPADIIEKMVEGRIRKFYEEVVFLEQGFVMDPSTKVSQVIEQEAKALGKPIELTAYVRYALGEGIEKAASNFADEVAAQLAK
ncbi:MAG: elongation factor Ts [Alphaproteobacteria bacterium]|nr:elongation factor Ts [Alphaproteobacteria bacterium]OJV45105.1 MAG: translation elongation factor Ts [Alphaproteobacteria bacterium 43-37]